MYIAWCTPKKKEQSFRISDSYLSAVEVFNHSLTHWLPPQNKMKDLKLVWCLNAWDHSGECGTCHVSTGVIELQMNLRPCVWGSRTGCHATAAIQAIQWTPIECIRPVGAGLHKSIYSMLHTHTHRERKVITRSGGKKMCTEREVIDAVDVKGLNVCTHTHRPTPKWRDQEERFQGGIDSPATGKFIVSSAHMLTCSCTH